MEYYLMKNTDVIKTLATELEGLSQNERELRLQKNGRNVLTEAKKESKLIAFLKHFHDLLIYVLIASALIKIYFASYSEAAIIMAVVIINAAIGYIQERKAIQSLNSLSTMMSSEATILRENKKQQIDASLLVTGDIVLLHGGQVVPADIRILKSYELVVEEAMLTGESEPVLKNAETLEKPAILGDRLNMLYSGSLINSGSGVGVVVATGDETELGNINQNLRNIEKTEAPLIKKMHKLSKQIFISIVVLIIFLLILNLFTGNLTFSEQVDAMISLAISSVPEGLPAVLSIILSLGVGVLAKNKAIVKQTPTVETLGSVQIICSDKTGTLTKNEMSVLSLITPDGQIEKDTTLEVTEEIEKDISSYKKMLWIAQYCNDSKLYFHDGKKEVVGNPTEGALLEMVLPLDMLYEHQELYKIPFDSKHKYMAVLSEVEGKRYIFLKGAPDVLLKMAAQQDGSGNTKLDFSFWEREISKLAGEGKRVLAAAYKEVDNSVEVISHKDLEDSMVFAGLYGIIDPPKPEAIKAIAQCQKAGITVKMITGDHQETAVAIAREIGLSAYDSVLTGTEIDQLSDEELQQYVLTHDVFARTTPEHKLRLVNAIQKNGNIVGMTGDGVNDAPALKKADIGIAMGIKGTQVSKDAADMVLSDDNFATIAKAVEEGRRVYENLKKTIYFTIPTAFAQGLLVVVSILLDIPLPLTAIQILWLNMVTTITLSFALGFEPATSDIMKQKPRDINENILNRYAVFRIVYVSVFIAAIAFAFEYLLYTQGYDSRIIQTVIIQTVVFAQVFYMLSCRHIYKFALDRNILKNKVLWITLVILLLLQMISIYTPLFHDIMHTASLSWQLQFLSFLGGLIIFIIVEAEKFISYRYQKKNQ